MISNGKSSSMPLDPIASKGKGSLIQAKGFAGKGEAQYYAGTAGMMKGGKFGMKRKKKTLSTQFLMLIGVALIGGAYLYRTYENEPEPTYMQRMMDKPNKAIANAKKKFQDTSARIQGRFQDTKDDMVDNYVGDDYDYDDDDDDLFPASLKRKLCMCCCCCCVANCMCLPCWMTGIGVGLNLEWPCCSCLKGCVCCQNRGFKKTIEFMVLIQTLRDSPDPSDYEAFWNNLNWENWLTLKITIYAPSLNCRNDAMIWSSLLTAADTVVQMNTMRKMSSKKNKTPTSPGVTR